MNRGLSWNGAPCERISGFTSLVSIIRRSLHVKEQESRRERSAWMLSYAFDMEGYAGGIDTMTV